MQATVANGYLGWMVGFEPTTTGITIRRSTKLSYTHRVEVSSLTSARGWALVRARLPGALKLVRQRSRVVQFAQRLNHGRAMDRNGAIGFAFISEITGE